MSDSPEPQTLEIVAPNALEALQRGEIQAQAQLAQQFPRSLTRFVNRAREMVALDKETAESMIYCRPVGKENGKPVYAEGMSIRMAEVVAATYGNLRWGSMLIDQTERKVVARGFCQDMETGTYFVGEVTESTVGRNGEPYSERQRILVAQGALAKAARNAVFKVVPKSVCKPIENAAREIIHGQTTLEERRKNVEAWIAKKKIDPERVWRALEVSGAGELSEDHLTKLTGLRTAIQDGDTTIDEAFPAIIPEGRVGKTVMQIAQEGQLAGVTK